MNLATLAVSRPRLDGRCGATRQRILGSPLSLSQAMVPADDDLVEHLNAEQLLGLF